VVFYLIVYAFMNLGAFAVVIAVARKTRSGQISSYGGLFSYSPGLATLMTIFLASLAGVPPFAGFWAKFNVFRAMLDAGGWAAASLAVVGAVNSVIAVGYYMGVLREMWMRPVPDGDTTMITPPAPIWAALGITAAATLLLGIFPGLVLRFGDLQDLTGALGG
jgi:NADH-quinone oxidoreductase subunit N